MKALSQIVAENKSLQTESSLVCTGRLKIKVRNNK